jgi:hypothetical protein
MESHNKFIGVSGYGWTGSSALYEKFKSDYNFSHYNYEYALVWDLNGLLNLVDFLITTNDPFLNSSRIDVFLKYISKIESKKWFLNPNGLNISIENNSNVLKSAFEMIENLIVLSYDNIDRTTFSDLSSFEVLLTKLKSKILKKRHKKFLITNDILKIKSEIKEFQDKIFKKDKTTLLDQPVSIHRIDESIDLFNNMKLIIIDRDPRDIISDLSINNALLGVDFNLNRDLDKYITWHKYLRQNQSKKALKINFENLILNEIQTLDIVDEFIGEEPLHNKFDLYKSKKNIGIWKKNLNTKESDFIKKNIQYEYTD